MGARIRAGGRATVIAFMIAIALVTSAWLAYATSAPGGNAGSSGGVTTTTIQATTTTTCKPGNGFGDKNHCHTGPPGQVDKDNENGNGNGKH